MSSLNKNQKAQLASELVKQAPPGEFREVVSDVRTILNDDDLLKDSVYDAFAQYNMATFTPCSVVKGSDSLVTVHAKSDEKFIDNRNKITFTVDHLKREGKKGEKFTMDSECSKIFDPIDEEVIAYVKNYYKAGNSAVYVKKDGSDFLVIICIESHAYSPNNFWNGGFLSEYTLKTSDHSLTGRIKAQIHYYEDGNVQMLSHKDVSATLNKTSDFKDLAKQLVKIIQTEEQKYQSGAVDGINSMMDTTFKALRRALPITRSKIDWNKLAAYGIGHDLHK